MTCVPLSLVLRQGLHCYSTVWRDWRVPCRMAVIASGLNRSSGLVPKLSLKINTATPFCDILWQTSGKVLENYESMSCGLQHAVWLRRNEVAFFDKTNFEPLSNPELWNVNIRKAMCLNRRLALNWVARSWFCLNFFHCFSPQSPFHLPNGCILPPWDQHCGRIFKGFLSQGRFLFF